MIRRVMPWRRGPDWFDEASAYVDGELSSEQVTAIERELQRSTSLRAYVDDLRAVQATLQAMPEPVLRRSYTLSAADAERFRPGFSRAGGVAQGGRRTGGIFAAFSDGLTSMRLAATFSTVATAALVAVVLVDLTVDDGVPSQQDRSFAETVATTEAFSQAASSDGDVAAASVAESAAAAAPVAPASAEAEPRSAPAASDAADQASDQSEQSAPVALQPADERESPVAELADEAASDAAAADDGSPALAAAAPAPPASDDASEVVTPLPPGTVASDEDSVSVEPERDGPPLSDEELAAVTVGTGGGLADESASDESVADLDEPSPPSESAPTSESTSADDGATAVVEPEVSADPLPATGQDDAESAPVDPTDGGDDASAGALPERESAQATPASAPELPLENPVPTDRSTAGQPADQPQPLPAADDAAPVAEEAVAAPNRVAEANDGENAAGDADSATDAVIDDDDDGLILALEIVFAVAAGLGLIAALWFRRRSYGRLG